MRTTGQRRGLGTCFRDRVVGIGGAVWGCRDAILGSKGSRFWLILDRDRRRAIIGLDIHPSVASITPRFNIPVLQLFQYLGR